jgi:hypothetical protein
VFVYYPNREMDVLDEPEALLPMPEFAADLQLSIGELFGWLAK